ncbi:MAG: nucleotidyl transferase AbiEii/AbiGii toxin family protein [Treponema sp.]|nr:nucleotidyl transferase AbiEii/AbiGii toxin family protein [Treponema sp.]
MIEIIRTLQTEPLLDGFFLAGGTALALQIGHRKSIDIDLFSVKKHDYTKILDFLRNTFTCIDILSYDENAIQAVIGETGLDIISIKGNIIDPLITDDGITMLGINDISAMKMLAIEGRKKAKDYIDIAYILNEITLVTMFKNYQKKYGNRDIIGVKKALTAAEYVNPYEWEKIIMLKNDIYLSDIPEKLKEEVNQYNKKHNIGKTRYNNTSHY